MNIAFIKKAQSNSFLLMVIALEVLLLLAHFSRINSEFYVSILFLLGAVFLAYKRYFKKEFVFNKLLFYTSLSFFFYAMLQSPVFPHEMQNFEILYFVFKYSVAAGITFYFYKRGFCNLFSYLVLLGFLVDSALVKYVNLGISKSSTEYYSILESTAVLLVVSTFFEKAGGNKAEARKTISILYVMAHLSNYWAAGFAKVQLDGGPLSWFFNDTMANLKRAGLWELPMEAYSDFITGLPHIHIVQFLGNCLVYIGQLLSAVVPFFPALLAPLTIFYDFFHIAVGALAGVFFYKWIFVNLLILAKAKEIAKTIKSYSFSRKVILSGVVIISYYISSVVPLGWYETRQGNLIHAHGTDIYGEKHELHTQFFGSAAFSITNKTNDAFIKHHQRQMGTFSYETMLLAKNCQIPVKQNEHYLIRRETVSQLSERYLGERSFISKVMIYAQPYHLLIPHWRKRNTMFGSPLESITFELYNYCMDENFEVYHEELVDSFTVR